MSKAKLDPWRVICAHLFNIDSYSIPGIIDNTGIAVDWSLTDRQDYSNNYRKNAYRPRINAAYESLSDEDKLRVSYTVATALVEHGQIDSLNDGLQRIGWRLEDDRLMAVGSDVRELFFPKNTQHDAYVEIRNIFKSATKSITVVDPYLDSSTFIVLGTISSQKMDISLLTYNIPNDFALEAKKYLSQHTNINLEVRKTREFHDRFVVLDSSLCWHLGCSIKDAGNRAFMISKIEDQSNRDGLLTQIKTTWENAKVVAI